MIDLPPFGDLLKQLRKRAGMTQRDLAAALNYSGALISSLEKGKGQPNLEVVITRFIPALGLQDDPDSAADLIESAAAARGERPPALVTFQRARSVRVQDDFGERLESLPSPPTLLIGRTKEVNQLCNRLLGHSGRLLTLVGPPGIGKTQLALAVAVRLQHHYADGVAFVALAEITDLVLVTSAILAAVGGSQTSSRPPKIKLIEYLRRKRMFLVLDNCEQIEDAAPLVAELLAACAGIAILATSRERLHLRAEQRHQVLPLELTAAVELFSQRAAAVNGRFEVTEANRPTVEAICERLDCLPLALELCAAQTDLLSLPQLVAHLRDRRLDLLVDGARDLPLRQRNLRHTIHSSYSLLSEEERTLLRTLGVFAGGFTLAEFLALSGWSQGSGGGETDSASSSLSTLHALIGKSLVRAETLSSGDQRFLLLETIREFALERLRAQGEEALLRERHYATYLQLFRDGDRYLRGSQLSTWLARLEAEEDNLRAALQWTLDEARYADAAWLMVVVHFFWFLSGHRYEGARWLAQLLPHRLALAGDLRLATLISFYSCAIELEEFAQVKRYTDEVMQLLEECSNKPLQAATWFWLARTESDAAHAAASLEQGIILAQAAAEAPASGNEFGAFGEWSFILATILQRKAADLIELGEVAQAMTHITESLKLFRQREYQYGIANCLGNLGRLTLLQGDLAQAHALLLEVITLATRFSDRNIKCSWQPLLGIVTLYRGDAEEARRLLNESQHLCLALKNKFLLAQLCTWLAEMALWEGDAGQAERWLKESLAYQPVVQNTNIADLERLFIAARLATMQGHYKRAATLLGLAEAEHRRIHFVYTGPMLPQVSAARLIVGKMLGTQLFEETFAAGQQLALDEAFTTKLALGVSDHLFLM